MKRSVFFLSGLLWCFFAKTSLAQIKEIGDAKANMPVKGAIQLTGEVNNQRGWAYWTEKIDLTKALSIEFKVFLGYQEGADGIVVMLHNDPRGILAQGSDGGALGYGEYGGITPSIGIEFDTHYNPEYGDPDADHVAFVENGNINHSNKSLVKNVGELEDGQEHLVKFTWNPGTKMIAIYYDGVKLIEKNKDLLGGTFASGSSVFFGISGSTGGLYNVQYINKLTVNTKPVKIEKYDGETAKIPTPVKHTDLIKDTDLEQLKDGDNIVLQNIHFEQSKAKLLPESYEALDQLLAFMQKKPKVKIEISGHTDNIGDFDQNTRLSRLRANAVANYLIDRGISVDRILTVGKGSTQPIASNDIPEERVKNRRVEVKILKTN